MRKRTLSRNRATPSPRRGLQAPPRVPDEARYAHVRGDLVRIGLLALSLFGALVLLRLLFEFF